jgi:pilus assembly protein Flp/PilA
MICLEKPMLPTHIRSKIQAVPDKGQTLVEYALLLALIALVVVVVLRVLGPSLSNLFQNVITIAESV